MNSNSKVEGQMLLRQFLATFAQGRAEADVCIQCVTHCTSALKVISDSNEMERQIPACLEHTCHTLALKVISRMRWRGRWLLFWGNFWPPLYKAELRQMAALPRTHIILLLEGNFWICMRQGQMTCWLGQDHIALKYSQLDLNTQNQRHTARNQAKDSVMIPEGKPWAHSRHNVS